MPYATQKFRFHSRPRALHLEECLHQYSMATPYHPIIIRSNLRCFLSMQIHRRGITRRPSSLMSPPMESHQVSAQRIRQELGRVVMQLGARLIRQIIVLQEKATFIPRPVLSIPATTDSSDLGSFIGLHVLTISAFPNANVVAVPFTTSKAVRASRMALLLVRGYSLRE